MNQQPSRTLPLLAVLGQPIAILAAVLAIGGGVVYWSAQRAAGAHDSFERERTGRDQARDRLARVDEEHRVIERYGPAYRSLAEQGIIGAEQRVNWLDALRLASQATRGFGVDYQVSGQAGGQQGGQPAFKLDTGAYAVQQSEMKLRLRLLHEGDLLAFLNALAEQRAGLHLLRECNVQRLASGPFNARFEPKLQAECTLTWVTLDLPAPQGGQ
jgi:hypothetical protein